MIILILGKIKFMYKKYQTDLKFVKEKLTTIDFILEKDDDHKATFGNNSAWKIELNGKWYDNYCYISIKNEAIENESLSKKGLPLWMFMKMFGVKIKHRTIKDRVDFIIKYKDKIFDENFKYKQIFNCTKTSKDLC